MIQIVHKEGKNNNQENWRLSITFESHKQLMTIKTENFKWGFRDGEDWNKIATFPYYNSDGRETCVTYITKDPNKMETVKDKMINKLREIIIENITHDEKEIKRKINSLKKLKNGLNCALFREYKIDEILGKGEINFNI